MRINRLSPAIALLFLALGSSAVQSSSDGLADSTLPYGKTPSGASSEVRSKASPKGTLDAPVDGRDGKPHNGPWVETGAERDRKRTKADSTEYSTTTTNKASDSGEKLGYEGKQIPHSNAGVMDDPDRVGPKEGTRGTEGGMSEKTKDNQLLREKVPETPKEARPLPHSEQEKIPGTAESSDSKTGQKLLEKPDDLPERPHSIPHPKSPGGTYDETLDFEPRPPGRKPFGKGGTHTTGSSPSQDNVFSPIHSLFLSLTMILFSEVGDKTFLVAALMAMRHPRLLVFSAAFSALIAMTVLSAVLGHAVPTLIPAFITKFAAAILFLAFSAKMFKEAHGMSPDEGVGEEMKEVEMELEEKEHEQRRLNRDQSNISPYALEAGRAGRTRSTNRIPSPPASASSASSREVSPERGFTLKTMTAGTSNLFSLLLSPAWVQTFVMTFLGEWGDRSQIATIAMAAGQDYWWVTIGAVVGHAICTAAAVIGGRAVAGRVSLRAVTMGGACAFLLFGIIYFIEALY